MFIRLPYLSREGRQRLVLRAFSPSHPLFWIEGPEAFTVAQAPALCFVALFKGFLQLHLIFNLLHHLMYPLITSHTPPHSQALSVSQILPMVSIIPEWAGSIFALT